MAISRKTNFAKPSWGKRTSGRRGLQTPRASDRQATLSECTLSSGDAFDGVSGRNKVSAPTNDTGVAKDYIFAVDDEYATICQPVDGVFGRRARRSANVPWAPTYSEKRARAFRRLFTTACQVGRSTGSGVMPDKRPPPTPPRGSRAGLAGTHRATPGISHAAPSASRRFHPATNCTHTSSRSSSPTLSHTSEALPRRDHAKQPNGDTKCDTPAPGAVPPMRRHRFYARPSLTFTITASAGVPTPLPNTGSTPMAQSAAAFRTTRRTPTLVLFGSDTPPGATSTHSRLSPSS